MTRRGFLATTAAALGLGTDAALAAKRFEISRSDSEWRAMLSDLEYKVMREEGTERAFTSPLNDEKRAGTFLCKGCDLPLYSSKTKFDSGTGWPSFWQALPDAVETKADRSFFMTRTECHCRRCGSHLGHIFDDGPQPTGKRRCINGVSLTFRPA
ncbi:peptide-methionine (R)-S-oxide reductase MsrB [Salipiger thiooxidans]|uniref:peptide-methionine (R)-S-oxide reductase MsrB n=1 Tax=Salipiger thiooxidans TaxID=282683 RepID=UPI001CD3F830|nr:peptide-methionine (R)-S-oxide reductase MsrB [Salipiger thiooxidans]MCA0848304.1 peptide-methionine (R)-S-oxide reductase MsrB [Salipiger thiooxidans]